MAISRNRVTILSVTGFGVWKDYSSGGGLGPSFGFCQAQFRPDGNVETAFPFVESFDVRND
ncbi:MAG: hypothetical protein WAN65_02245 [Candidatus Sulfotelmatobacter sp.]